MSTSSAAPVLDASTSETLVRFHMSLNVGNLASALAFYRVLLDVEPAKVRADYAKYELTEPPLVLSLIPGAHSGGGALNHVGMRLVDAERLVQTQARLEMAGYTTQREEGVACCYARQTKFWVTDPDRTLWELYILHDDADVDHAGYHHDAPSADDNAASSCAPSSCAPATLVNLAKSTSSCAPAAMQMAAAPVMWHHNLTQPLPERIEQADDSVDEVQLQGTLNVPQDPTRLTAFLAEVRRVLRPGGRVLAHGLVANRPLTKAPTLPGPAALVSHVPVENWPAETLAAAGFVNVQFTKLGVSPCFTVEGAELRESKVVGHKPAGKDTTLSATVIYRGPFLSITDDQGHSFTRGQRVAVCSTTLALLKASPLAEQFTFLDGTATHGSCDA